MLRFRVLPTTLIAPEDSSPLHRAMVRSAHSWQVRLSNRWTSAGFPVCGRRPVSQTRRSPVNFWTWNRPLTGCVPRAARHLRAQSQNASIVCRCLSSIYVALWGAISKEPARYFQLTRRGRPHERLHGAADDPRQRPGVRRITALLHCQRAGRQRAEQLCGANEIKPATAMPIVSPHMSLPWAVVTRRRRAISRRKIGRWRWSV
jgi:hypothetical protein